jgi:hypothetical protein
MSTDRKSDVMSKEEMLKQAISLATPIDFEALVVEGILEKKGAGYKILDMKRLPDHAGDKIIGISSDGTVKFSKATKFAQKLVDKLSK